MSVASPTLRGRPLPRSRAAVHRRGAAALALVGYGALAVVLYGRPALAHLHDVVVGSGQSPPFYGRDQGTFVWDLTWARHAVTTLTNPFVTHVIYAPYGFDLAWSTIVLAPALLILPVTIGLGPVVAYNVLALAAPATAAWVAFLLCRDLTTRLAPALAGGLVFGFSTYETVETINHVDLALTALVPLAALLGLRRVRGELRPRWFVPALALTLAAQLYTAIELFASLCVFGGLTLVLATLLGDAPARRRLMRVGVEAIGAVLLGLLLAVPYLYYVVARRDPLGSALSVNAGNDLANLVVPTQATWLSVHGLVNVGSNVTEETGYLGLPLLAILCLVVIGRRHTLAGRLIGSLALLVTVASLGSALTIGGHARIVELPWWLVRYVPLLGHAIPARFTVFLWLVAAVAVAFFLDAGTHRSWRWALVVVALAAVAPNETGLPWGTRLDDPPLIAGGTYARYLRAGSTGLFLPYGINGDSMYWQALAGFRFRIAEGYASWALPHAYAHFSIMHELGGGNFRPRAAARLDAFLDATRTRVVLERGPVRGAWRRILASLGARPVHAGGFTIYRVSDPGPTNTGPG